MGIKWTDGSEIRTEYIEAGIYGPPSAGKTSLALTAEDPALLDFDGKSGKAMGLVGIPILQPRRWEDVADLSQDDLRGRKTLVLDTVGAAVDMLGEKVRQEDRRHDKGGALTLMGWGVVGARFRSWVSRIKSYGVDVVYVAHQIEERRSQDETADRILASGQSKSLIMNTSDIFGHLKPDQRGRREIHFQPVEGAHRKNVGLPNKILIPDDDRQAFAGIIAQAKVLINRHAAYQAEAQEKAQAEAEERRGGWESLHTPEDFTAEAMRLAANHAPANIKRELIQLAKDAGLVYTGKELGFQPVTADGGPDA